MANRASKLGFLNYDASVPMDERAPISIKVDPSKPPGIRTRDYIPHPDKLAAKAVEQKRPPRPNGPVERFGRDYMPASEVSKIRNRKKNRIQELAKEIYGTHRAHIKDYEDACKLVNSASDEELANPSKELKRALKIRKRGRPITKKQAIAEAKKRVMKE